MQPIDCQTLDDDSKKNTLMFDNVLDYFDNYIWFIVEYTENKWSLSDLFWWNKNSFISLQQYKDV